MNDLAILIGIGIAVFIGATSPGPSFLVVSRISISKTRLDGLFSALGMALGGLGFAIASLFGLSGLLLTVPSIFWLLKTLGGIYLIYLGVMAWINARNPVLELAEKSSDSKTAPLNSFLVSLGTQLSNPKAFIIYSGVFATFLPHDPSFQLGVGICAVVFSVEFCWYMFVVSVLSSHGPRRFYLHYKSYIDRMSGSVLSILGLKLIFSER